MSIPTLPSTHTWVQGGPILDRAGNYALYTSDTNQVWVWNEDTGTQVTNLLDANANPITTVPVVGGRIDGVGVPVAVQLASFSVGQFGPRYYALPIQTIRNANAALAPTDTQVSTLVNTAASSTAIALGAHFAPLWQPNTAYTAGQAVVNPSGDLVTAKVGFTSGSSYSATNWNLSASYAPPLPASPAAFNLPMQNSGNTGLTWTTSQASVARALGWTIVTDPVYGAVADDTTDNLAKFNAAVTATPTGGTLYVPPAASRYYLSAQLDLSAKPIQLVGGGWNCTVQPAYGSAGFTVAGIVGSVLRFGNTTGAGVYVGDGTNSGSVRDLAIIGPGSGSSRGLQVGNTAAKLRYRVERVLVGNWFQGFWTCMENSTVIGLYALGNDSGITLTNASNGNTFVGTDVELSTTYGVRIDGSSVNLFSGGVFQGGSGTTISLVNASSANIFDTIYLENLGATYGVNAASGCDYNGWRNCHFGYSSTHDQVVLASNHNQILWPQVAPQVTVSGATNFFIGLFVNGTNSDTGSSNVWIDTGGGMGVKWGARDVRINSGQKFYFETTGSNSYITRDNATADTVIGSGSGTTRVSTGGFSAVTATKTGSYTLTTANDLVIFNGATLTATLPDPTTSGVGRTYRVKNINASALTVVSAGTSKTIDGAASQSLAQWASGRYVSDGTQWLNV